MAFVFELSEIYSDISVYLIILQFVCKIKLIGRKVLKNPNFYYI